MLSRLRFPRAPASAPNNLLLSPALGRLAARRCLCTPTTDAAAAGASEAGEAAAAAAWPRRWGPKVPLPERTPENEALEAAGKLFHPSRSKWAVRERLGAALERARQGGEFYVEAPQPRDVPGPVFAVMSTLTERGPLTSKELYEAVEAQWPGVLKSPNHLKRNIMQSALVNQVMKIRHNGSQFKEYWVPRRPGQIRMTIARREKNRNKDILHSDPRRDKKGRKVPPPKRWPPGKWYVKPPVKKKREKAAPVYRPLPGQEGYVSGDAGA